MSMKIHLPSATKRQSTSHQTHTTKHVTPNHTTKHHKCTIKLNPPFFTEQNDRCGNSTAQSQAPDDGYINVRNMLST